MIDHEIYVISIVQNVGVGLGILQTFYVWFGQVLQKFSVLVIEFWNYSKFSCLEVALSHACSMKRSGERRV